MKRVLSLLAVVFTVSSVAYAQSESRASEMTTSSDDTCPPTEYPPTPVVPEGSNLDTWDFTGTPLLPTTSVTKSLYLVAFEAATDPNRLYVYGIDVGLGRILFAATVSKRYTGLLTQRAGIDIGNFQTTTGGGSGISIDIEGPTPPPPPPNIHDPYVQNYGILAWEVAVDLHRAAGKLHH